MPLGALAARRRKRRTKRDFNDSPLSATNAGSPEKRREMLMRGVTQTEIDG